MSKTRAKDSKRLVLAAVAGLLAGGPLSGCEGSKAPQTAPADRAAIPRAMEATTSAPASPATTTAAPRTDHSCAGKNECKGQGGCGSGDNHCAGKNSCKGKGGCSTAMRK